MKQRYNIYFIIKLSKLKNLITKKKYDVILVIINLLINCSQIMLF